MINSVKNFPFWCQKVLPLVYEESLSYYEVLCKLTDYINRAINDIAELEKVVQEFGVSVSEIKQDYDYLCAELEKVKNGEYSQVYLDSMAKWIDKNLEEIVSRVVQYIVFGLSNDGHFVAYIPNSWKFMKFNTIVDNTNPLYGHLLMEW